MLHNLNQNCVKVFVCNLLLLLAMLAAGCTAPRQTITPTPLGTIQSSTALLPTPRSSSTHFPTQLPGSATPVSGSSTPTVLASPTPDNRPPIKLVLEVRDVNIEPGAHLVRSAIWLLEQGSKTPYSLLDDPKHSYEGPRWSPTGEWIGFLHRDIASGAYTPGVTRPDGTGYRLLDSVQDFLASPPLWSQNDAHVFMTGTSDGEVYAAYAVNLATGQLQPLFPEFESHGRMRLVLASRSSLVAAFSQTGSGIELWLTSLDGQFPTIREPVPSWPGCPWISGAAASPDGAAILVQPASGNQSSACGAALWRYDVAQHTWHHLDVTPRPDNGQLAWSSNGRWVAWWRLGRIIVLDVATWQMSRNITLASGSMGLTTIWTDIGDGSNWVSIQTHSFPSPPNWVRLWAYSPDHTATDYMMAEIVREPDWLPPDTEYVPIGWQPR
jgi:hypothetical protein